MTPTTTFAAATHLSPPEQFGHFLPGRQSGQIGQPHEPSCISTNEPRATVKSTTKPASAHCHTNHITEAQSSRGTITGWSPLILGAAFAGAIVAPMLPTVQAPADMMTSVAAVMRGWHLAKPATQH